MATTYNNLYMDIRQELHRAGIDAATLEARELVAFAAGKTRQELLRDGRLYVPQEVERRARELMRRHLAGEQPSLALKVLEKWLKERKPLIRDTS